MISAKRPGLVRFPSTGGTLIGDKSRTSHSVNLALTGLPLPSFAAHQPDEEKYTVALSFSPRPATIRVGMASE